MKHRFLVGLLAAGLGLAAPRPARAQSIYPIHSVVDQLPELPTGGGTPALEAALAGAFRYPTLMLAQPVNGLLYLNVVVTQAGQVASVDVERSRLGTAGVVDSLVAAVQAAVRRLPTLKPATLQQRPVSVIVHMSWSFTQPARSKAPQLQVRLLKEQREFDVSDLGKTLPGSPADATPQDERVYAYAEQMPSLPGGGGGDVLKAAVQQALVVPAGTPPGQVYVSFVVTQQGLVSTPAILKGLSVRADAAALAAVRRLPVLLPGRQNGRPVRVRLTVPVTFSGEDK